MPSQFTILFNGICLFLTDKDRVLLAVADSRATCPGNAVIPKHTAHLSYTTTQRYGGGGKPVWKSNAQQSAVKLSGLIKFTGNFMGGSVTYPGSNPKLPNVIAPKKLAPYLLWPNVDVEDPATIDTARVAVRVELPPGAFDPPHPTQEYWHFFPVKNGLAVRMQIAPAVLLKGTLTDNTLTITEQPFGGGGPNEVVTLKDTTGAGILIIVGNSSAADITPSSVQTKPAVGPDHDFELHWNLFDHSADPECPPLSFNEGLPGSPEPVTLGGGNCPPTQWP